MPLDHLVRSPAGVRPANVLRAARPDEEPAAEASPPALDANTDALDRTSRAWARSLRRAPSRTTAKALDGQARDALYRSFTSTAPTTSRAASAASASTAPHATLRRGDRGPDVLDLQSALQTRGHDPGPVDGIFGAHTRDAVMAFQREQQLDVDGIVGPRTWAKLLEPAAPPVDPVDPAGPTQPVDPAPGSATPPRWSFDLDSVPGTYDARNDVTGTYDIGGIRSDAPGMWNRTYASDIRADFREDFEALGGRSDETYGQMFRRVGAELGVDPYALAAYSVFESYNSQTGSFNPHMNDVAGDMHAAGLAATQAQDVRGSQVPGLDRSLPADVDDAAWTLRASPEIAVRYLAAEMKAAYERKGDLARAFPVVAFPAWGDPQRSRGAYGTQAEYVSRAKAVYDAFADTDR